MTARAIAGATTSGETTFPSLASVSMTEREQIDEFSNKLDELVNQYRSEFDLTYASVVGTLQMKAWLLCQEAEQRSEEV